MSWWSDLVDIVSGTLGGEANITNPQGSIVQDASGWLGFINVIEGIWAGITDGKFWRSLGWLLLGITLMLLGVLWWIGPSAARSNPAGVVARGVT